MTLREATTEKHKLAEIMPFNIKLLEGKLSTEAYVRYLYQMSKIYKSIEDRLSNELPMGLLRANNIIKDLAELDETYTDYQKLNVSTNDYSKYLRSISVENLWAHVYLNYMALMYGGQLIKRNCPGSGTIYDFENKSQLIDYIRLKQVNIDPKEVNNGFDYIINIYHELDN